MLNHLLHSYLTVRITARDMRAGVATDESGEGVISAAIAVLVMAFLGAAMWVAFSAIFDGATDQVGNQVDQIGG